MGSSVSCTRNTKVTKTELENKEKSKRKIEECIEKDNFSSHSLKSDRIAVPSSKDIESPPPGDHFEAPPRNDIVTPPPTPSIIKSTLNKQKEISDDKDTGTDKSTNEKETGIEDKEDENKLMTVEELEEFRTKTLNYLRDTAEEVVALQTYHQNGGAFVTEIYNAAIDFYKSYYALENADRVKIEKFRIDIAELMMETKYFNLSCKIVMYTYMNGWRSEDGEEETSKTVPVLCSLAIMHNLSDDSDEYAIGLANEPGFLDTLIKILRDSIPKYFAKEEKPKLVGIEVDFVENSLGIIHNMSMRETNISRLRGAGMVSCLKPYLKSPNTMHALSALASLAGLYINEEESDVINSNKEIVMVLLDFIRKGMKDKMRRCNGWSCRECVFTVKLLARNDANMKTLVELGALELLVEMAKIGDDGEQYESVSALWALCFDEDNKSLITGKPEVGVVDLLVDLKTSENEKIKKVCNGALWTLRDALKKTVVEKYKKIGLQLYNTDKAVKLFANKKKTTTLEEDKASTRGHVMISYQWADQQVLKNVRDNIKARGYKVWMDIDQMGGSTLQAMAEAVEGADVFLMCMSNKYKHSPACRAEAEYAFQLRKRVIPLKMERGYTPDGWLGFIVGAKLFYEFSPKYPFEVKMKALLKEIDSVLGRSEDVPDSGKIIKPQIASVMETAGAHSVDHADTASSASNAVVRLSVSKTTIDNVRKWTADDVKKWIVKNGLEECGISSLRGGDIALIANMRVECPEFFYKCLQDMLRVTNLSTLSTIVWALHDLS